MANWKTIENCPRNTRVLVTNDEAQEITVASFERLSHIEAVYGWVFGYSGDSNRKKHLVNWEPTHWMATPDLPAKPKCKPGKCERAK